MGVFKGKRLLISGGPALACSIVEKAKEMGIYAMVTDWYPDSPAKRIADESFMISTADIDAMVNLAKESHADGVFTSFIDSNLQNVREICEHLNFPFYATKEQLDITMDKVKFKQLCRDNGVPVVEEFYIDDQFKDADLERIKYPILLKPADNSGSRGIMVCNNEFELRENYDKTLSFSEKKSVIVEKFMDLSQPGVNLDYVICDGEVLLSAIGDLYVYQQEGSKLAPLTSGVFYPSRRLDEYISELDEKVKKMYQNINLKNGTLYIQSFYDEEGFHFYEMGYRLGGGQSYQMISKMNQVNHLEMLICHSLTGKMCDNEIKSRIDPRFNQVALGLFLIVKPGLITKVDGLKQIREIPEVVNVMEAYKEGDQIPQSASGTTQQIFGRIHFVAKDIYVLVESVTKVQQILRILDADGNNMLMKSFDPMVLLNEDELIDF